MALVDKENPARSASDTPASWAPLPGGPRRPEAAPTLGDRMKDTFLGPALPNEALAHERLGNPTALAVFSSDALSSTAYATEEILGTLLLAGLGLAAFHYVLPITLAMVAVLAILVFSYRQTIKAYPSAGGAYIVTKDNLGLMPAQVAGVALLTDYILTVAVSVSAGTAAMYSAVDSLYPWRVPIALFFIALIAWGNLRGVKESGKLFAAPTYGFIISVIVLMVVGVAKAVTGNLHPVAPADPDLLVATGTASLFVLLHAFASGGAAMTGVEAISNGVPAFRRPEWRNARQTLTIMGVLLGVMFIGLSWLAVKLQVVPSESKTVISQIARGVLGGGIPFFIVQLMTMLILVLAANTSFADFPRLASFHAEDAFMPRQLTKRGHRLAFSNGIIFLSLSAAFLVVLFQADVSRLIPLYAIGVFTSFSLSQTGMAVRHIRLKEPKWGLGLAINGTGAVVTGVVTIVIAITKFTHGAWAIMLLVPLLVATLVRLNRQYEHEASELGTGVPDALAATVPATHVAVVLVDKLDNAAARALLAARTLRADRTEAVHLGIDEHRAEQLLTDWSRLRADRFDLRVVHCPDRKLEHAAQSYVLGLVADGRTTVSVLIPRLLHVRGWHRLLHDRTSDRLSVALSKIPHVTVTVVPYHLGGHEPDQVRAPSTSGSFVETPESGDQAIGSIPWRTSATVSGRVVELVAQTLGGTPCEVAVVDDGTGQVDLLFLGRVSVAGMGLGAQVRATGLAAAHRGRLTMMNPEIELLASGPSAHAHSVQPDPH